MTVLRRRSTPWRPTPDLRDRQTRRARRLSDPRGRLPHRLRRRRRRALDSSRESRTAARSIAGRSLRKAAQVHQACLLPGLWSHRTAAMASCKRDGDQMREPLVGFLGAFASDGKERTRTGEDFVEKLAKRFILRTLWPLQVVDSNTHCASSAPEYAEEEQHLACANLHLGGGRPVRLPRRPSNGACPRHRYHGRSGSIARFACSSALDTSAATRASRRSRRTSRSQLPSKPDPSGHRTETGADEGGSCLRPHEHVALLSRLLLAFDRESP